MLFDAVRCNGFIVSGISMSTGLKNACHRESATIGFEFDRMEDKFDSAHRPPTEKFPQMSEKFNEYLTLLCNHLQPTRAQACLASKCEQLFEFSLTIFFVLTKYGRWLFISAVNGRLFGH